MRAVDGGRATAQDAVHVMKSMEAMTIAGAEPGVEAKCVRYLAPCVHHRTVRGVKDEVLV